MPPTLGGLWNRGKELLGVGGNASEGPHDSSQDPVCDNSDVEEVSDPNANKKRKLATHVEVGGSRKKVDARSAHEKRLQGDYDNPPDAVPIAMPQRPPEYERMDELHQAGTANRVAKRKPGAGVGAFRPQNNLSDSKFMAKRAPGFVGSAAYGDGFGRNERGPAQKRQKTEPREIQQILRRELEQDRIEDPDEDDANSTVKVVGINGKRVYQNGQNDRTQSMVRSESQPAPFEGNEARSVDKILHPEQKKKRRAANGNRPSQTSSRASPVVMTNGHSGRTAAEAVPIDDDTSQEVSQHHAKVPPPSSGESLPDPKAIMNGVNEVVRTKQRRQSDDSVEYTHTEPKSQMPPPAAKNGHASAVQQPGSQPRARRKIEQDGDTAPKKGATGDALRYRQNRPSEEPNTRNQFRRDTGLSRQATNGTTTQRSRMKENSGRAGANISPARDSIGSADELTGPTTIASVSPEKRGLQANESRARSAKPRESRSPSASDLRPTAFTQSGRTQRSAQQRASRQSRTSEEEDDRSKIYLANFFATSCVLTEGNITLQYDQRNNELDIYYNNELQVVPGEQYSVHIGRKEVSSIVWGKESKFVLLKGPSNIKGGVSNGSICFTLANIEDKSWLATHISAVVGESLNEKAESPDRMASTFRIQANELLQLAKKRSDMAEHEAAMQQSLLRQRSRKSKDQDQIRYEDDEPTRPNRRKGMLGDTIEDDEEQSLQPASSGVYEHSRYFADSAVRRSTRQTKSIKQKSPTPPPEAPKWTKVHKPDRWPHSVVYPNEGARRVTVDFQDLERLDEGEFLNDNVISFALRRIEEKMAPEHKERVHFFNSFFYTALTTKNGKKDFNYDAVKRWTKSKDLLGCDYVVVPINIDLHWFVAIICNLPNLSRRIAADEEEDTTKSEDLLVEDGQEAPSDPIEPPAAADVEQSARETRETPENEKGMRNLSLSDGEGTSKILPPEHAEEVADVGERESAGDAETPLAAQKAATATGRKGKKRGPPSFNPENPSIITLDSFGSAHTTEVKNLKDYISSEAKAKRGIEVDRGQLQGANIRGAGIPTQSNFWDCGVYLVGYVEQFAKDPEAFATKALQRKLGDAGEFEGFDPSQKRDGIREELLKLQKEQEAEHKAKKAGKKAAAPKMDGQATASAAASPKPESKPASKAASPARGTGKADAAPSLPPRQQPKPSWAPVAVDETTMQPAESQDKDLEYEPPRAL